MPTKNYEKMDPQTIFKEKSEKLKPTKLKLSYMRTYVKVSDTELEPDSTKTLGSGWIRIRNPVAIANHISLHKYFLSQYLEPI